MLLRRPSAADTCRVDGRGLTEYFEGGGVGDRVELTAVDDWKRLKALCAPGFADRSIREFVIGFHVSFRRLIRLS